MARAGCDSAVLPCGADVAWDGVERHRLWTATTAESNVSAGTDLAKGGGERGLSGREQWWLVCLVQMV